MNEQEVNEQKVDPRGVLWWIIVGVLLTMLLSALDQTVVSVAAYRIADDLDSRAGVTLMPWLLTAYMLASTVTQPLYGKLSDLYGIRRVYLIATGLFLAGSVFCGLAQSMTQLIAMRAVQGIGAGGLYGVSLIILSVVAPPRERARVQGFAGILIALAVLLGPLIGGFLTGNHSVLGLHTSWRWIFYVNIPLGAVAITVVAVMLRVRTPNRTHRLDYPGALLVMTGAGALLLVTTWGGTRYAWRDPAIVTLGVAAAVLLAAFLWRQARAVEPIVPPRLFRNPIVAVAAPLLFVFGFALIGSAVYVALYMQVAKGLTPTSAGVHLMPMIIGTALSAIVAGIVVANRGGKYKIFPILGTGFATVGLAVLSRLRAGSSLWLLSTGLLLLGLGLGLLMQILVLAVQNAVPRRDLGTATTAATFIRTLGQSIGVAVFGAVLTNRFDAYLAGHGLGGSAGGGSIDSTANLDQLPDRVRSTVLTGFVHATDAVFGLAAVVMFGAFVLSFFLEEIPLREIDDLEVLASEQESPAAVDG